MTPAEREAARLRNRAEFPGVAAIMDDVRAAFGNDVRVAYAVENGRTLGTPIPDDPGLVRCTQLAPPSAQYQAFYKTAVRAFVQRFGREPRKPGDGEWIDFLTDYTAKHYVAFQGGDKG